MIDSGLGVWWDECNRYLGAVVGTDPRFHICRESPSRQDGVNEKRPIAS